MDHKVKEKTELQRKVRKPQKPGVLEQALAQIDDALELEYQKESWWSILVFWIRELRWRRTFWEKMGRPPEPEINNNH
jgi:hypothetical protein